MLLGKKRFGMVLYLKYYASRRGQVVLGAVGPGGVWCGRAGWGKVW